MPADKVVHLTSVHDPKDTRIYWKECRSLNKAGYDVSIVGPWGRNERVGEIDIHSVSTPPNRFQRMLFTTGSVYRVARSKNADLYHIHDPELLLTALRLKRRGAKIVYDAHEDLPGEVHDKLWIWRWLRPTVSAATRLIPALVVRTFNGVVAATPEIARHFPGSHAIVVQNFPIVDEFEMRIGSPYSARPPVAVYIGGIDALRGIKEMVQAFEFVPEHLESRFELAGMFEPLSLEADVRKLRGWQNVDFHGQISRTGVASLLGRGRVGLVLYHPAANHTFSQPTKLFEYMAAGIPVVASDFPRWREIVEGAGCGILVDPLDPRRIAQAVAWLLENPKEAEEMGRRGREAVLERYSWRTEAEKLIGFYKNILRR